MKVANCLNLLCMALLLAHQALAEPGLRLLVFVPTEVRISVVEDQIQSACPTLAVTAFGRAKDFHKMIETEPPDALLSLLPVIERQAAFRTVVRGIHDDSDEEPYVLASIDQPVDLAELHTKTVGVVDLLGRKPMTEYIVGLLQTQLKVKRVTKQEDLLPLLTFGAADAVFVSRRTYESIKQKSNQNVIATPLNINVGLVAAALADPGQKAALIQCVQSMSDSLNELLGVQAWR